MFLVWRIRVGVVAAVLLSAVQGFAQVPSQTAPLRPLAVTQLDERQQGSDLDSTRPVTITLSDPIPIPDLLLMLVRETRLSVAADPDVQGTFRGDLKDVTVRQALEMILQPHGFDYSVQGNLIRVFKRRLVTRRFDLNYVVTRRSGSRTLAASNAITPNGAPGMNPGNQASAQGSSVEVTGTDNGNIFSDLSAGVQTLLSPEGRFNVDEKAALLQATDYPDRLDQIQLYLDAVQNRATRQVKIEAKVIEVTLSDEFSAGINWNVLVERAGDAVSLTQNVVPSSDGTFTAGLRIKDFTGLLRAFAAQGKVNVMASPTVNALNNEPAIMRVGTQDVFFKTTTQTDAVSGRILQTTVEPQAITEGVVLSVTPQIGSDGMINLSITPSLTERTGHATSRFGDTVPILSVREADTLVRVHENDTIVIAGLMEERMRRDVRKVPFLGDLPGIGAIFRGETTSRRKTDLVILLTPTIMTPGRVAPAAATELERVTTR
ncbi:MAG TPA: secretin and TonB N-terminal domain-containing protein [Vicinamibacterales bacterium]|nr:secretin and TonB N-terminal domain-containing protein [Vicinamibacterales bacterium]